MTIQATLNLEKQFTFYASYHNQVISPSVVRLTELWILNAYIIKKDLLGFGFGYGYFDSQVRNGATRNVLSLEIGPESVTA